MNTDLVKKVESLAIWWIPATLLTHVVGNYFNATFSHFIKGDLLSEYSTYIWLGYIGGLLFSFLDNLVVGIWLYHQTKSAEGYRAYLWAFFGLAAGLPAAILFIALLAYDQLKGASHP